MANAYEAIISDGVSLGDLQLLRAALRPDDGFGHDLGTYNADGDTEGAMVDDSAVLGDPLTLGAKH